MSVIIIIIIITIIPTEGWPGWVGLGGWLHTEMVYLPADGHRSRYGSNPARRRLTLVMWTTTIPTKPNHHHWNIQRNKTQLQVMPLPLRNGGKSNSVNAGQSLWNNCVGVVHQCTLDKWNAQTDDHVNCNTLTYIHSTLALVLPMSTTLSAVG